MASLYIVFFLLVAGLMFFSNLIGPYVPWFSKPYVSHDPPPLVTAFYCANLLPAMLVVAGPILYIFPPPWHIPFLSSRKPVNHKAQPKD